jgi:hypothetical protein
MGFTVYYRSTSPIGPDQQAAIQEAVSSANKGRTWLECEPIHFFREQDDGHLFGGSKPNFMPHPDDVASAERRGLPPGDLHYLLETLCVLSRDHGVDWELSHDHSSGPIGEIRRGVCDAEVENQIEALASLADILGGELDELGEDDFD